MRSEYLLNKSFTISVKHYSTGFVSYVVHFYRSVWMEGDPACYHVEYKTLTEALDNAYIHVTDNFLESL